MPIEMPKGLPFSVDTWNSSSIKKRLHFLTHAHKDHSQGISTYSSYPIYATSVTKILTLQFYPQLCDSVFVDIEIGESVVIDDPYGRFSVTAFDANHCPGAVMFLFEGDFGNILHTGDSRLTPECLQKLPEKYLGKNNKKPKLSLDYVFLDCTFGKTSLKMPTVHSAIQQVINCIWKNPDAPTVYLTCDLLGQEHILLNVYHTFGSKIYVDKESNPAYFQALNIINPEIITEDSSSLFHLFEGFPNLQERTEAKLASARANFKSEPLIIRPSAQWYACEGFFSEFDKRKQERYLNEALRDNFGIWHVCYSMHSSRDELEWALQILAPKWVVSTTPECRAMELNYVKKNCFISRLRNDDPLWKLMDINVDPVLDPDPDISISDSAVVEEDNSLVEKPLMIQSRPLILNQSPQRVTLFGRARLGLQDSFISHKMPKTPLNEEQLEKTEINKIETNFYKETTIEMSTETEKSNEAEKSILRKRDTDDGSSEVLSANFSSLYYPMNFPVLPPLPSLVELMKARKLAKRRFEF